MNTAQMDTKATVLAEFENFLTRCEAAGVPRQEARSTISGVLAMESLNRWCEEGRVEAERAANTPKGVLLQKAFDLWKKNERISRAGITPDQTEFNAVCLTYLHTVLGVAIGDNVKVYGWAKPRGITVEGFQLSFHSAGKPSEAFMFFSGPCWLGKPSGRAMDSSHGCSLDSSVIKHK